MDDADPPAGVGDDTPGVLGNLPTTRPQHRSARRRDPAAPARKAASHPVTAGRTKPIATAATAATSRRAGTAATPVAPSPAPPEPAATPEPAAAPDVPAPPPAPRSGWATPAPTSAPAGLPPLVALADGAVRVGAQVVRGVLRRLPGR